MAELIVLVLYDPGKLSKVLEQWTQKEVPGITILASRGTRQQMGKRTFRDDLPLFTAVTDLLEGAPEHSQTLLAVVPAGFALEDLVKATELIIGRLDAPNTGILFTVPVSRVWGRPIR